MPKFKSFSVAHAYSESASDWATILLCTALALVLMFATTWGLAWRDSSLYWFGIEQTPLKIYRTQQIMTLVFFSEWMWHCWSALTLFFWIPCILVPLTRSLTPAGGLWLRMTRARPIEVRLGMVIPAIAASSAIFIAQVIWALLATMIHDLPLERILITAVSGYAYHLATVAFVVSPVSRALFGGQPAILTCAGALSPSILFMLGWAVTNGYRNDSGAFWPFSMPYYYLPSNCFQHSISLAFVACLMGFTYLIGAFQSRIIVPLGESTE